MAPRRLNPAEQAFVDKWVPEMFHFMKMMRRANRYILTAPKELYAAAYKQISNSGFVAGGEWDSKRRPGDKSYGTPKRKDSEAYIEYMKGIIECHPINSAYNATMVFFVGNAGASAISKTLVIEQSQRATSVFWVEVTRLNKIDLREVLEAEARTNRHPVDHAVVDRNISRDPDERPLDRPFVRSQPLPGHIKVSQTNWQQYERVRQILFFEDNDDDTGYTAIELAGILYLESGKFYKIRYEGNVDSIRITENEMLGMIEDGLWV